MKVEDAIDVIETEIKFQGYVETSMILEALKMAIKSLKKQKPTIPSRIIANYSDNLRCRECHMPIKYMDNYCSYCGQKIDAQL